MLPSRHENVRAQLSSSRAIMGAMAGADCVVACTAALLQRAAPWLRCRRFRSPTCCVHPTAPALFPANTVVQAAGWEHDAASGMLKVQWQAAEAALPSHAQHLERLTECMIDLEAGAAG